MTIGTLLPRILYSFRPNAFTVALSNHANGRLHENEVRTATGLTIVLSGYGGRVTKQ